MECLIAALVATLRIDAEPRPSDFDLEIVPDQSARLSWFSDQANYYDLEVSTDLRRWNLSDGYPKKGTGFLMEEHLPLKGREFFRMATSSALEDFLLPEVKSYQAATGITLEAANEINQFLRYLRGAGVEPKLFWVGGSRYNSVNGSKVRAVIGGTGSVINGLGPKGERYETFYGSQAIRFPNPLKNGSQSRVGLFAGATPSSESGSGSLISGGETNPMGPSLTAGWGSGGFRVFDVTGNPLLHSSYGGFVRANDFTPYVGGAFDGSYSVLCGIGKTAGRRDTPLRYQGMPPDRFPNGQFVNSQDHVYLGYPYFSGRLHFAVITDADLTNNPTAYQLISIPRKTGYGPYGQKTAVVFLGDSILVWSNAHIWNSDGQNPPHKGGGQWNRRAWGLLANATGEGNDAQIEYFDKGANYALDPKTWDHLYYVCGSGGHYRNGEHPLQNPLSQDAKESVDAWIQEYHERIALPAGKTGASVIQMLYIYGCPQNESPAADPEKYRAFSDYFVSKQQEVAASAGFTIFDVYHIPQLHAPLPAFYADMIHPNAAGCRLIAQEFAATVGNPESSAPRSLKRPHITGLPTLHSSISVSLGEWTGRPTSFTYQWMRDATDIPGANQSYHLISTADLGHHLSCRIGASNQGGSAERTSAHTAKAMP